MKAYNYYIYILSNWNNKVIYVGMTNNLVRRIYEHKNKLIKGFTSKYNIQHLVYRESTSSIDTATEREKQIKGWLRAKRIVLFDSIDPEGKDLSEEWCIK